MIAPEPRMPAQPPAIAYFSMEVGLDPAMPTYAGGLGVLAGDTLRAAADLGVPMVGVTLLHRKGFFRQHLDAQGNQSESPSVWYPEEFLEAMEPRICVTISGRAVQVRAWRYLVRGVSGHTVPVYLLDTALPENSPWDQALTDHLYHGGDDYRLCQEVVLGLGGVAMLRALGHERVQLFHMNEGHSALLALALLEEQTGGRNLRAVTKADTEAVRQRCVFTTHTPVPAGHDQFPLDMVHRVLGEERAVALEAAGCCLDSTLNTTYMALVFSHYINGVSQRHHEISHSMFPYYPINSITNGVHAVTWTAPAFQDLYDRHIPEWRRDNLYLRYAISIPVDEIQQAHAEAKRELLAEVKRRTGVRLDPAVMTIGFARRAAAYKRADLLLSDLDRLGRIARQVGPLQLIYAGKSHPRDESGKAIIRHIFEAAAALGDTVPLVYLEEYDMALGKYLCAGVDLWLNSPQKPHEASGTSGMKAALNGVPSLSVLDGWWIEGHVEGVTGWSIGDDWEPESDPAKEIASLYDKLEYVILPLFYGRPTAFAEVMRSVIALNASFFNAQRMLLQYVENAYQLLG
jgi:starch phosphorylase